MRMNLRCVFAIFLLTTVFISFTGCGKQENDGKVKPPNAIPSIPESQTSYQESHEMKRFFPAAAGNTWTYMRTITRPPLYCYHYVVREPSDINLKAGDDIVVIGHKPNIKSGSETYKITSQQSTRYYLTVTSESNQQTEASRDGRYDLNPLNEVIWDLKDWPVIWELKKGAWLDGSLVECADLYALFKIEGVIETPLKIADNVPIKSGLLPNSTKLEILDMIEVGCLTPIKEEAAYDGEAPVCCQAILRTLA